MNKKRIIIIFIIMIFTVILILTEFLGVLSFSNYSSYPNTYINRIYEKYNIKDYAKKAINKLKEKLSEDNKVGYVEQTTTTTTTTLPTETTTKITSTTSKQTTTSKKTSTTKTTKTTTTKRTTTTTTKKITIGKVIPLTSDTYLYSNDILVNNPGTFMPDKFNTGINPDITLKKFKIGDPLLHFKVVESPAGTSVINFYHTPNQKTGTFVISNYDFSDYYFRIYDHEVPGEITIIFKNCKFGKIGIVPSINDKIHFKFENCQIGSFYGSNSTFDKCKFGHGTGDAMNPFRNIYVNNCFFGDLATFTTGELHLDGMQVYGKEGIPAENIHFYNTRFETPYVTSFKDGVQSKAYVNAPIMIQLEYSDGNDITFDHIWANGGGFSIYSHAVKGTHYSNIKLTNIKVGYGHIYGILYPNNDYNNVTLENVDHYDNLLIGSIWKSNDGIHISTSNDTLVKRNLTIVTNVGTFKTDINAHPQITKANSTKITYNDLPYDIELLINSTNITYVKCYDTTNTSILSNNNLLKTYNF